MKRILIILLAFGALAGIANAHEARPAYLQIREIAPDIYDILWKVPARADERLAIYIRLPSDSRLVSEPGAMALNGAYIERFRVHREGGFANQTIRIDGLESTNTNVLVRVEFADGSTQTTRMTPGRPSFVVQATPSVFEVAGTYLLLGIEHILGGIDHLLFVLALLMLVKGRNRLVATVTTFTIAHSLTLAAAVLGFVHLPQPPVEAVIALSIVFVASEIVHVRRGRTSFTERRPWLVAFAFGLLHGLGFAAALSEVGLPQAAIPAALLFFNLGVEMGQLGFIAAMLLVGALIQELPRAANAAILKWGWRTAPYFIGTIASFWLIQRIAAF